MKFWDSSALLPLVAEQPTSPACRQLLRLDPVPAVWCLTRTEIVSAVWRQRRLGRAHAEDTRRSEKLLEHLTSRWVEVGDVALVRDAAERLLRAHPLTAADSLQLGAALVLFRNRPKGCSFVCLDEKLMQAAEREGFSVVRPQ